MDLLKSSSTQSVLITQAQSTQSSWPSQMKFHRNLKTASQCQFKTPEKTQSDMRQRRHIRLSQDFLIREKSIPTISEFRVGTDSMISPSSYEYYETFRNFNKINELVKQNYYKPNTYTKMLKTARSKNLLPKTLGLLQNSQSLSVAGKLTNTEYFDMFLEGLRKDHKNDIECLDLSNNTITPKQLEKFSNYIPKSLIKLVLTSSKINRQHSLGINKILNSNIQNLQLSNNNIGDFGLMDILSGLNSNQLLSVLNLSYNKIGNYSMMQLGLFMKSCKNMQELYLQFNSITGKGGFLLLSGIIRNSTLKVLDLSHNNLGNHSDCVQMLCKLVGKGQQELLHFDVSNNNFTIEESQLIASELSFNRTIYGFHYENHQTFTINSRGFLVKDQEEIKLEEGQTYKELDFVHEIKNNRFMRKNSIQRILEKEPAIRTQGLRQIQGTNIVSNQMTDICWICQGWVEMKFTYHPGRSGQLEKSPIFIHFDFEHFRPTLLEQIEEYFQIFKMCPPNVPIKYFFSNPIIGILACARDQGMVSTKKDIHIKRHKFPIKYSDGTIMIVHHLPFVNYKNGQSPQQIIDSERHYYPRIVSKPRQPEKVIIIEDTNQQKWSIDTSFFKCYQPDSEDWLSKCLDFDLQQMKIYNHIEDKENFKQTVLPLYAHIVQYYKYMTSQSQNVKTFPRIDEMGIRWIYEKIKKQVQLSNWTLMLVSTQTVKEKEGKQIHELSLVRYQFLEMLIRISLDQQSKFDKCMYELFGFITEIERAQEWRDKRYWTQIMDITIDLKMPLLQGLFQLTHQLSFKKLLKPEKYLIMQDVKTLFQLCDLLETQITEQELYQIYLQSQELVIDELTQTDHFEMKFAEFVEALARAAELISPSSPHVKEKDIPQHVRKTLPLYIKFEGLLYIMFHKLRGKLIQLGYGGLEQTVVNNTILKSWQIKKRGINLEFNDATDSDSDSDGEQKKKTVIVDPEKIIDQILYSEKVEQEKKEKEVKVRGDEKRRTVKFSQPFNSMRFISDADEQQKKIEEQLIENGSPLTRMRLQLRRHTLRQFDFELQEGVDFIYDSIKEK